MYTQCPDCTSVFEISPEHLGAAGGMVQCGVCNTTFNALRRLSENPPETKSPDLNGDDNSIVSKNETPTGVKRDTQKDVSDEVEPSDDSGANFHEESETRAIDDEATIAADEFSLSSDVNPAEASTSQNDDNENAEDDSTDSQTDDETGSHDGDSSDSDTNEEVLDELLEDLDENDELVVVNPDDLFSTSQILDEWDIEEGEHDLETLLADDSNLDEGESDEESEDSVEQADAEPASDTKDEDEVADEHDSLEDSSSEVEEIRDLEELEDLDELAEFDEEDLSDQDLIDADLNETDLDDLISDDENNEGADDDEDNDPNTVDEDESSDEAQEIDSDTSDEEAERSDDERGDETDSSSNDENDDSLDHDNEDSGSNTIDENESSDDTQDAKKDKPVEENENDEDKETDASSIDKENDENDAVAPDSKDDANTEERGEKQPDSNTILTAGVDGKFDDDYSDAEDLKDLGHYLTPKKSLARRLGEGLLATLLMALLAAQYIHHNRTELATHPKLGTHIRNAYHALGKDLRANWKVADYRVARHTIVPNDENADILMARATIVNNSDSERPLPLIRLQLKNRWGDAIYGRVFTPAEYLDENTPDTLPGNGKLEVTLDLVHPAPDEEIGYSFDVCLDTPAGPDCGTPQVFTE